MPDLLIRKLNEAQIQIDCEYHIAKELEDYFTFENPGSQFARQHLAGWDGKTRLFSIKTNRILAGLVPRIKDFAKHYGYTVEYEDTANKTLTCVDTKTIINDLKLPVEVRDYQRIAVFLAMMMKRTILLAATSSGKSLIIYAIIRSILLQGKKKGLLIVPTTSLVDQMYTDFKDYSVNNGWDVEKHCQKLYEGMSKVPNTTLLISTWQSIYTMESSYFKQFDFVIGDEAHTCQASSLLKIFKSLTNAEYRIGTSGTLQETKVHYLTLEGIFGSVQNIINTKKLIDMGYAAKLNIKCLLLKYSEEECEQFHKIQKGVEKTRRYHEEIEWLIAHSGRNNFIKNLVLTRKGNTRVLYTRVEDHGKILFDMIKSSAHKDRKVYFVYSGVDAEDRNAIRAIVEKENDAIIVASYGTFSTGINIKRLHNVVMASPTKSRIRLLQSIGRSLRLGDEKDSATLYDLADDLRFNGKENTTLNHYEKRIEIYSKEKHDFTTTPVRITANDR